MMAQHRAATRMNLAQLLDGISAVPRDVSISDLTLDSRTVVRGGLFLACRGISSHGLDHVSQAIDRGAAAVVWEPGVGIAAPDLPSRVIGLPVPELSRHVGQIADRFFDSPSQRLRIAGITGTNGKTTTAWLLAQALEDSGHRAGYAGTLGWGPLKALQPAVHTTPDCVSVHRELSDLRGAGVRVLGMEVSSHALASNRIDGVRFDTTVFTNLSRDHLDFHRSMEAYGAAKARLFSLPGVRQRVINLGDEFGRQLAAGLSRDAPLTAVWSGAGDYRASAVNFLHARSVQAASSGLELEFESSWGNGHIASPLLGEFNAENLLASLAVLLLWDVPLQRAVDALSRAAAPAGRMETFGGGVNQPLAVVDYAHSPDALAKALRAARQHCRGRLWCVFGCGGDRDAGKRPLMGAIAAELADEVVLTDDNPRREDPDLIIAAIQEGMPPDRPARVIRARALAIATALGAAAAQDIVLIAGKGHEDHQIYGTTAQPFSDRSEVRKFLGGAA